MSFVHLHCHSEYSLLDGFSNIKKLVKRAKEMGMPAVALTDHGAMHGVIDFYAKAREAGVKPIIGLEAYLAARGMRDRDSRLDKKSFHLLLLAENETGYRNLMRIASAAQLDGFYYYPRIDREFLAAHSEGLICTSGCMSADVPRALLEDNPDEARRRLDWYYEVFGRERFFIELQQHEISDLHTLNRQLLDLGARYQSNFLATNDVHYVDPGDARLQDILLAIQTGCLLSDPNRMRMTDASYYLRPPEEMARLFAEVPQALSNTLLVAERCGVELIKEGYHLPRFSVPEGDTPVTYLRRLCLAGLQQRYGPRASDPAVLARLDYELGVISAMGFAAYFLIVWDLCNHARQENIWYTARGSAAGSLVAYVLDITLVEPIDHGLIFERFLNPGRVSMPDIDLDFQDDKRYRMLDYCVNKYGSDKVAQIITFGTMGARAAIRDVARVMNIPLTEVDKIAKLVPNIPGKPLTVAKALEEVTEFKTFYKAAADDPDKAYLRELIDTASQMEGVVRSVGTHAAGVVIADEPLVTYLPLHRVTGNSEETPIKTVTQFEMGILETLGMLKVDFLGLITLTVMQRACDLIRARHKVDLHLGNIPLDDPATFDLLGRGQTAGVFQVEGTGMKRYLVQMKPKTLAHVIAMIALYRPGPLDFIPDYIQRMHGEAKVEFRHPLLQPIFEETYGIPVYQEQIMRAAVDLAGYTMSESDDLRKAIAKKQQDKLEKHKSKFIAGAVKHGLEQPTAAAIFHDWEEFARYGFNKSHAAVYGVISVQTAYLKARYPAEYMAALLSAARNETAKLAEYILDCRALGLRILPPDINFSELDFSIETAGPDGATAIRYGLAAIKNVGEGAVQTLLDARRQGGPFRTLDDLCQRVDLRLVGKRALECLVKVGALDSLKHSRAELLGMSAPEEKKADEADKNKDKKLEGVDALMNASTAHFRAQEIGQLTLFGGGAASGLQLPKPKYTPSQREMLAWEKELIGLYVSPHPLQSKVAELQPLITAYSGELTETDHDRQVVMVGMVTHLRPYQTKKGDPMGFISVEDLQGHLELVAFPRAWKDVSRWLALDKIIVIRGRVDAKGSTPKVLVDSLSQDNPKVVMAIQPPPRPAAPPSGPNWEDDDDLPPPWLDDDLPLPTDDDQEPQLALGGGQESAPEAPPVKSSGNGRNGNGNGNGHAPGNGNGNGLARREMRELSGLAYTTPPPAAAPRRVRVTIRSSHDKERDKRRLRRLHGLLVSYPGRDRFEFLVVEYNQRNYQLHFPNDTTGYCEALERQLVELLGPETVEVRPL